MSRDVAPAEQRVHITCILLWDKPGITAENDVMEEYARTRMNSMWIMWILTQPCVYHVPIMREINSVFVYKLQNTVVAHVPMNIVISRNERTILAQSRTTLLNLMPVLIGVLINVYLSVFICGLLDCLCTSCYCFKTTTHSLVISVACWPQSGVNADPKMETCVSFITVTVTA